MTHNLFLLFLSLCFAFLLIDLLALRYRLHFTRDSQSWTVLLRLGRWEYGFSFRDWAPPWLSHSTSEGLDHRVCLHASQWEALWLLLFAVIFKGYLWAFATLRLILDLRIVLRIWKHYSLGADYFLIIIKRVFLANQGLSFLACHGLEKLFIFRLNALILRVKATLNLDL